MSEMEILPVVRFVYRGETLNEGRVCTLPVSACAWKESATSKKAIIAGTQVLEVLGREEANVDLGRFTPFVYSKALEGWVSLQPSTEVVLSPTEEGSQVHRAEVMLEPKQIKSKEQREAEAKAAAEREKEEKRKRYEAESELKALMPILPNLFKADDAEKLRAAIDAGRAAGVAANIIAAAEAKLRKLNKDADDKAAAKAKAEADAEAKKKADAEAKVKAEEKAKRDKAEGELRALMPTLPTLASLFKPADASKFQAAIDSAKEAGASPDLISAAEAKLESLKTKEQKDAEAKANKELKLKRDKAEGELRALMPTLPTLASLFKPADAARLQAAIDAAKEAGASEDVISAAEAKLESLKTKEQKDAEAKKRERAEFELKSAMPTLSTLFLPHDAARLQAAIDAAKEANVSPEIIAAGEAKLQEMKTKDDKTKVAAAERELRAAMPSLMNLFQPADPAKLQASIDQAKQVGVKSELTAAAEAKLEELASKEQLEAEAKLQHAIDSARQAGVPEETVKEAEAKLAELRKDFAAKASARGKGGEAKPADKQKAAERELRAARGSIFVPATPERLQIAIDGAKEAGVSDDIISPAQVELEGLKSKTNSLNLATMRLGFDKQGLGIHKAEIDAEAKEKADAEAKAKKEEVARQKEEAQAKIRAEKERARWKIESERELKEAMPSLFHTANPVTLQNAIDQARRAGVKEETVAAAEAKLADLQAGKAKAEAGKEAKAKKEADDKAAAKAKAEAEAEAKAKKEADAKAAAKAKAEAEAEAKAKKEAEAKAKKEEERVKKEEHLKIQAAERELSAAMPLLPTIMSVDPVVPVRLQMAIDQAKQAAADATADAAAAAADAAKEGAEATADAAHKAGEAATEAAANAYDATAEAAAAAADAAKANAAAASEAAADGATKAGEVVVDAAHETGEAIEYAATVAANALKDAATATGEAAHKAGDAAGDAAAAAADATADAAAAAADAAKKGADATADAAAAAADAAKANADAAADAAMKAQERTIEAAKEGAAAAAAAGHKASDTAAGGVADAMDATGHALERGADWVRPRPKEAEAAAPSASAQQPLIARLMEDAPAASAPAATAKGPAEDDDGDYEYEYYDAPVQPDATKTADQEEDEGGYDYYEETPTSYTPAAAPLRA